MDLKEYISSVILQIAEGVKEAQEKTEELGIIINPESYISKDNNALIEDNTSSDRRRVQMIEFDITLNTENYDLSDIKTSENGHVKFTLPICLPCTKIIDGKIKIEK